MESDNLSEEAVKRVILASVPEREEELNILWEKYRPQIIFTQDKCGFLLEAGPFGSMRFNHKTMCQIWLFGFVAQKAFHMYSGFIYLSQISGLPFHPTILNHDEVYKKQFIEAKAVVSAITRLNEVESRENFCWPKNIPEPENGKPFDIDGGMVFDLLCMAAGFCFLHEISHIISKSSVKIHTPHAEELLCDIYARDFMLQKIEAYSKSSGYNIDLLKAKRAMAIVLSLICLLVLTPKQLWGGSHTHPSISKRIKVLIDSVELSESSYFWTYLSCLLIFMFEQNDIAINPFIIEAPKSYCLQLIDNLDKNFTIHFNGQPTVSA